MVYYIWNIYFLNYCFDIIVNEKRKTVPMTKDNSIWEPRSDAECIELGLGMPNFAMDPTQSLSIAKSSHSASSCGSDGQHFALGTQKHCSQVLCTYALSVQNERSVLHINACRVIHRPCSHRTLGLHSVVEHRLCIQKVAVWIPSTST